MGYGVMLDGTFLIPAIIGIIGTAVGALIGALSTHWLYYKNKKSEERKIINESIHYLLEVFFLVNRLNAEKMLEVYMDYYLQEVRKKFPAFDDKAIASAKEQYYPQLKKVIVPLSQEQSYEKLEGIGEGYERMLGKLSTVLPVDAYYLRGKNDIKSLLQLLSEYFQRAQLTEVNSDETAKKVINQMQSSLTLQAVDEFVADLKDELLTLLKKTDRYNRKKGKKVINSIETTMLTEDEKHGINEFVETLFSQLAKNVKK